MAIDTTTIDNVAAALKTSGFRICKVSTDGHRIHHQATMKKVVNDSPASLDEEMEVELRQILDDLGLADRVRIERK